VTPVPRPIALCLEDLAAASAASRYLCCVALPGRQAGLRLGVDGAVRWLGDDPSALELWVSADEQLILYRPAGAAPVRVSRGGRALDAPVEKPVVLLHLDEVEAAGRQLRVHVHGDAPAIVAPSYFAPEPPDADSPAGESSGAGRAARIAAAALAIGAAVGSGGCTRKVEVRNQPPAVPVLRTDAKPAPKAVTPAPPVEVRDRPPAVAPPPRKPDARPMEVRDNPPKTAPPEDDQK